MDSCINEMGAESLLIAEHPYLLTQSMERWIAPGWRSTAESASVTADIDHSMLDHSSNSTDRCEAFLIIHMVFDLKHDVS